MKDEKLEIMKSKVLEAYRDEECSEGRRILEILFPDVCKAPDLKYGLGDRVYVLGKIIRIDEDDTSQPYYIEFSDYFPMWFREEDIHKAGE